MIFFVQILVVLSPVVFLIGLIRPKWILFWMKEPDRLIASSVGLIWFMGTFTAYSALRVPQHKPQGQQMEQRQDASRERQNQLELGKH